MPTTPTQFRLTATDLAKLDAIASRLSEQTGLTVSRADAIRHALDTCTKMQQKKKIEKKS